MEGGLEISQQARSRLSGLLSEILSKATCDELGYIDPDSFYSFQEFEGVPSQQAVKKLRAMIGDFPVSSFLIEELTRKLKPLAEVEGREMWVRDLVPELGAFSRETVDGFDSLPRRYTVVVELPKALFAVMEESEGSAEICTGIRLVKGSHLPSIAVYPALTGLAALDQVPAWNAQGAYLVMETDGFVARFGQTEVLADALEEAQSFLGALLACGVLSLPPTPPNLPGTNKRYVVCEGKIDQSNLVQSAPLDDDLSRLMDRIYLGPSARFAKSAQQTQDELRRIGRMFRKSGVDRLHGNLVLGSKWFLSSHWGRDPLLAYIQATVAVETLLGDKAQSDTVGLGALLGNRCAYLIAHSVVERQELLASFKEIYDVRSRIVHRGHSRLTSPERTLFHRLHRICGRVIDHEIRLLPESY